MKIKNRLKKTGSYDMLKNQCYFERNLSTFSAHLLPELMALTTRLAPVTASPVPKIFSELVR